MRIINGCLSGGCAVALGTFDGVHAAHRLLIEHTINISRENGIPSAVFTFDTHPQRALGKDIYEITPLDEKILLIDALGVDYLYLAKTDEKLLSKEPEEFISEFLLKQLCAKYVVVGFNFSFGKAARGGAELLNQYSDKFGVEVLKPCEINGEIVSSSAVRCALADGNIEKANKFLGREYTVSGRVESGKKLGRTIGFPTINLYPDKYKLLPKNGVYETRTTIDGKTYPSLTNVGVNPTVGGSGIKIETHIVNYTDDAYGKHAEIAFLRRIRDEMKFESLEHLKKQLNRDLKSIASLR